MASLEGKGEFGLKPLLSCLCPMFSPKLEQNWRNRNMLFSAFSTSCDANSYQDSRRYFVFCLSSRSIIFKQALRTYER